MRVAITTGEPVSLASRARIAAMGEQALESLRPDRDHRGSTAHRLSADAAADDGTSVISAPIGKPIRQTTIAVIDDAGREGGAGRNGELHIGGAGVARGYRQPCRADRRTIRDPREPGRTLHRTGDVVAVEPTRPAQNTWAQR